MSLLTLIQSSMGELGLTPPTAVVGNADGQVKQFLALMNAAGQEMSRQFEWQALNKPYMFTVQFTTLVGNTTAGSNAVSGIPSTAGVDATYSISGTGINQATDVTAVPTVNSLNLSQPATVTAIGTTFTLGKTKYTMPSDFDRFIDRTDWDKSKHWEMIGPETAQQWEWLRSGYISTGPRIRFRYFGGYFQIWPMVATPEVLGFEYVSNGWAVDTSGTPKSAMTADTDTTIFPDRLMVNATKLKYWQIKGFNTIALQKDYDMELSIAKANDSGSKNLSFAPKLSTVLIGWDQIPDSGYGT